MLGKKIVINFIYDTNNLPNSKNTSIPTIYSRSTWGTYLKKNSDFTNKVAGYVNVYIPFI